MTEAWLTGSIAGVHPVLMPAAHAFVQARDDVRRLLEGLTTDQIWTRPGDSASIGFHALHIAGATDRLLTYARGDALSDTQLAEARGEPAATGLTAAQLVARVERAIAVALEQIRSTPAETLAERREIGGLRLPSTVIGVIFHAAEHAARHAGQIATLRKVLSSPHQQTTTR